ncbi:hypothetical protein BDY17DRAFT_158643 [Neohortaea acidophila]|uniref:Stc1 domain-containing protein n=1 Tax=Neohortaea acidophila TaxID=245834 RepID=A0A6A6PQY6_9PEZI|nr:uncharacterized protein BDY17DRAFT_158643 [Neohortaea acidophila]KAF2482355.1 hypothetical protein BDY17DRAFT_158643 [Neohortaea acidophila]
MHPSSRIPCRICLANKPHKAFSHSQMSKLHDRIRTCKRHSPGDQPYVCCRDCEPAKQGKVKCGWCGEKKQREEFSKREFKDVEPTCMGCKGEMEKMGNDGSDDGGDIEESAVGQNNGEENDERWKGLVRAADSASGGWKEDGATATLVPINGKRSAVASTMEDSETETLVPTKEKRSGVASTTCPPQFNFPEDDWSASGTKELATEKRGAGVSASSSSQLNLNEDEWPVLGTKS